MQKTQTNQFRKGYFIYMTSNTMQAMALSWFCVSPFIVIILSILLYSKSKQLKARSSEIKQFSERLSAIEKDTKYTLRETWFNKLGELSFANETEVEIKFVYPLLLYLGYQDSDFSVRYKVQMQAGREQLLKEADWVVWRKSGGDIKAILVIEAKAPSERLDSLVQGQGRSYAFSVNARIYVLTNGIEFAVYERGVEFDRCALQCPVKDLSSSWTQLHNLIGVTA